ncbi:hypothetical protein V6N13_028194 [Hibiscus sabdariffa]
MIGTFDPGADIPRNSRKHRRLDDIPPDGGGEARPIDSGGGEARLFGSGPSEELGSNLSGKAVRLEDWDQDPNTDDSFGPWMMVERRPRRNAKMHSDFHMNVSFQVQGSRFNPIFAHDMVEETTLPIESNMPPPVLSSHTHKQQVSSSSSRASNKTKVTAASKTSRAPIICKPLTANLSNFPVLSRCPHSWRPPDLSLVGGQSRDPGDQLDPPDIPFSNPAIPDIVTEAVSHVSAGAKQFLRDNKPDVVVFVEPRICGKKVDSVISLLGFLHSHRIEATGFAGGIWAAWYDSVLVTIEITHFQFMHFNIFNNKLRSSLYAKAVYASPSASRKIFMWPHLESIASNIIGLWVVFGDFNAILGSDDRRGCAALSKPNKSFQNLLFDNGLRDMGFSGPSYTWSRGHASARLDRFICNSYFDEAFPTAMVHHLMCMCSDHRPIMLQIGNVSCKTRVSPFRYFLGWLSHDDFPRMVADNWDSDKSMCQTIRSFIVAADVWNKTVFGYLGSKKRIIMARLRGIQQALSCHPSSFLASLETTLLIELEHLLDHEELLWRQKSRSECILQGDQNTRYFYRRAISRRQRNKIMSLAINDGTWCEDESILKKEAARFLSLSSRTVILLWDLFPSMIISRLFVLIFCSLLTLFLQQRKFIMPL